MNKRRKIIDQYPNETCAGCGKRFWNSDLRRLADAIMQRKPICSWECSVKANKMEDV